MPKQSIIISLYLPPEFYQKLADLAQREKSSMNALCVGLLERAYDALQEPAEAVDARS